MLELQSLVCPQDSSMPERGSTVLRTLLEAELRDRLEDWYKLATEREGQASVERSDLDEKLRVLRSAHEKGQKFRFTEDEIASLALRIVEGNRRGRIGLALSVADSAHRCFTWGCSPGWRTLIYCDGSR